MIIFFLFASLASWATADRGPIGVRVSQFQELERQTVARCVNNPQRNQVRMVVNSTTLNCGQMILLVERKREELNEEIQTLEASCSQGGQTEADRLARASAQAAARASCRPVSTDTQCLSLYACAAFSMVNPLASLIGNAQRLSGNRNSCLAQGSAAVPGCLQNVLKGIFDSLWGLVGPIWGAIQAGAVASYEWVRSWFVTARVQERTTSERLMASQQAGPSFISRFRAHPIDTMNEIVSSLFTGIKNAAMESYGCEQWSGAPFVSECRIKMTSWNCASCQQKLQLMCGVAGFAVGEIGTALLTGGLLRGAAAVARAATAGIRAGARIGRFNRIAVAAIRTFPRTSAAVARGTTAILEATATTLTRAQTLAIRAWKASGNTRLAQALGRAARGEARTFAGSVAGFPLRAATVYLGALERATVLGSDLVEAGLARAGGRGAANAAEAARLAEAAEALRPEARPAVTAAVPPEATATTTLNRTQIDEITAGAERNADGADDVVFARPVNDLEAPSITRPVNDLEAPTVSRSPSGRTNPDSGGIVVSSNPSVAATRFTEGGLVPSRVGGDLRAFTGTAPRGSVVTNVTAGRVTSVSSRGEEILSDLGAQSFRDREIILDIIMGGPRKSSYMTSSNFDDAFRNSYRNFERTLNEHPERLAGYRREVEALSAERVAVGNQKTLEELNDLRRTEPGVRAEEFNCSNLSRLTPGAFPTEGGNCRKLIFDEEVNGRYCSCGGMGKTSFTWLVRCPTSTTGYSQLSTYVDELALPFNSAPEMCARVDIPRGKECYIGPTSPTFAGFGGTTQILCEHRGPRDPRARTSGPAATPEEIANYEAQMADIRNFGIQFGQPEVRPVRWAPFSTFTEYQGIVERAARACTNVCDINEIRNIQRDFELATAAIRARANPSELAHLASEQRSFEQYLRELREGRKTYPRSTEFSPATPAPRAADPSPQFNYEPRTTAAGNASPAITVNTRIPGAVRAPEITLSVAGGLGREERLAAAERIIGNIEGNETRSRVLLRAHDVAPEHGFGTYTPAELREKTNILRYNKTTEEVAAFRRANNGQYPPQIFSQTEADDILRRGLAGNADAGEAFADARSGVLRARELRGRISDGRAPDVAAAMTELRGTFRASAEGYYAEGVRTQSPQFIGEAWRLYARAGDGEASLRMMQAGVRDFGMNKPAVIRSVDQEIARLDREIATRSNPAIVLERDTLRQIRTRLGPAETPQPVRTVATTPTQPVAPVQPRPVAAPVREPVPAPAPVISAAERELARPVTEYTPRAAAEAANEYRLGTGGRARNPQRASELYYRGADGLIEREVQRTRGFPQGGSRFMEDRNFSSAFEESLNSNGQIATRIIDDIYARGTYKGLNSFLAENFQRFNTRNPSALQRENIRKMIEHLEEINRRDSALFDPQRNYLRSWKSANWE